MKTGHKVIEGIVLPIKEFIETNNDRAPEKAPV